MIVTHLKKAFGPSVRMIVFTQSAGLRYGTSEVADCVIMRVYSRVR